MDLLGRLGEPEHDALVGQGLVLVFDAVVEERAAAVLLLEELGERLGWSGLERLQTWSCRLMGS
jgi:hypothetical protein